MGTELPGIIIPIQIINKNVTAELSKLNASLGTLNATNAKQAAGARNSAAATDEFTRSLSEDQKEIIRITKEVRKYQALQKQGITLNEKQTATVQRLTREYQTAGGSMKKLQAPHQTLLKSFTQFRWTLVNIAMAMGAVYGAYKLLLEPSIKLETAMADVKKTTNLTTSEISSLRIELESLSHIMPISAEELAKISAVAGQMGIEGVDDIKTFTKAVALMTIATDMSADVAAKALGKIASAFDLPIENALAYASVINMLENTTAANAEEIVLSLLRVGASATTLGLDFGTMAAAQATLIGAGMQPSRAGTRMNRLLIEMQSNMEGFAIIAGTSTAEFARLMDENANQAILDVIDGLQNVERTTIDTGLAYTTAGSVAGNVLVTLTAHEKEFLEAIERVNAELITHSSVLEEAAIKSATAKGQLTILLNTLRLTGEKSWPERMLAGINAQLDYMQKHPLKAGLSFLGGSFIGLEIGNLLQQKKDMEDLYDEYKKKATEAGLSTAERSRTLKFVAELPSSFEAIQHLRNVIAEIDTKIDTKKQVTVNGILIESYEDLKNAYFFAKNALEQETEKEIVNAEVLGKKQKLVAELAELIEGEYGNVHYNLISTLNTEWDSLNKTTDGVRNLASAYKDLFAIKPSEYQKIETTLSDFLDPLMGRMLAGNDLGFLTEQLGPAYSSMDELFGKEKRKTELEGLISSLSSKIKIELTPAFNDAKKDVKETTAALKELKEVIKDLISQRFTGETAVDSLIAKSNQFIALQELEGYGIADPYIWLQEQINATVTDYDDLLVQMDKVSASANLQQDAFKAWRESIKEFIKSSIETGVDLGKNISDTVKMFQTQYLGISAMSTDGSGTSGASEYVNLLEKAKAASYGYEHTKVNLFAQDYEDSLLHLYDNSEQVIDVLSVEYKQRKKLNKRLEMEEGILKDTTDELDLAKNGLTIFKDELSNVSIALKALITSIGTMLNQAGASISNEYSMLSESSKLGKSVGYLPGSGLQKKLDDIFKQGLITPDSFSSGSNRSGSSNDHSGSYTKKDFDAGNTPDWIKSWHQSGGVVSRPTVAMLGEVGPERIVPLRGGNTDNSMSVGVININTDRPGSYYNNRKTYEATSKFLKELTK